MRVVLDTNVLVAAFLRPCGLPGRILRFVLQGAIEIVVTEAILAEYREVLLRPKFRLARRDVEAVLNQLRAFGFPAPCFPEPLHLPDPDDLPFLEAALASGAVVLVTGNGKDFPPEQCRGVRVVTPAEFLEIWENA